MNTKLFSVFSILISVFFLLSCNSEDRFVICRAAEHDCDYQHHANGLIAITKGSSRKHYILTEKGLKKTGIEEGEPVFYNPETGTALIKEETDSSTDIFTVNAGNGKELSSKISLKPEKLTEDREYFISIPNLLSGCVQDDGTIVLLVNYAKSNLSYSESDTEETVLLNVYEKGDEKKLKKYMFTPEEQPESDENENKHSGGFLWEEPKNIQCTGKEIYLFSEKRYLDEFSLFYRPVPNWILGRIDPGSQKNEAVITDLAFIAYDDIYSKHYYKKQNAVAARTLSSREEKTETLRIIKLENGYEIPEEPLEKKDGEFLFSETPGGKPLIFFVKTRNRLEDQRLELLEF